MNRRSFFGACGAALAGLAGVKAAACAPKQSAPSDLLNLHQQISANYAYLSGNLDLIGNWDGKVVHRRDRRYRRPLDVARNEVQS